MSRQESEKDKKIEALSEKFHEAFRRGIICPEWSKVSNDWRLAVIKGVTAVLEEMSKERTTV